MKLRLIFRLSALSLAMVAFGARDAQSQTIFKTYKGEFPEQLYGASVASIGDVDGDGTGDVAIGAPGAPGFFGFVRVVSGQSGSTLYQTYGPLGVTKKNFGTSIAGIGDVDGDHIPDFLVGSPGDSVFSGGTNLQGYVSVHSGLTGIALYTLSGIAAGDGFGRSVASVKDIDQDGVEDFIAGAPKGNFVRVFSGVDGSLLYHIQGAQVGDELGASTAGVGDVNADSVPDFLVGATQKQAGGGGYATLYSGVDSSVITTITGASLSTYSSYFGSQVASVGDIDHDGLPDFAVSDPYAGPFLSGGVWVFSGSNFSVLQTHKGWLFSSCGRALSSAGDVNGDGYLDILVGYDSPGAAAARVFSGKDGAQLFSMLGGAGTGSGGTITSDGLGVALCAVGDINHDGLGDFAIGAMVPPIPFAPYVAGYVRLYGGSKGSFENFGEGSFGFSIGGAMVPALGAQVPISISAGYGAGAGGLLIVGANSASTPWAGGTLFLEPLWFYPHTLSSSGGATIPVTIPQDSYFLGKSYYFQAVYSTPTGPKFTGGLKMTIE